MKIQFLQNNTVFGIRLQAHRGGTRIGNEAHKNFLIYENSFCYSWFRLQSMAIHVTDGGCRQIHFTRNFSHAHCTSDCVHTHCMAQDESKSQCVCVRISFHLHAIHDVMCLSVRWLFLVCLSLDTLDGLTSQMEICGNSARKQPLQEVSNP